MEPTTYRTIGLMSGTSLDGLDICLAAFTRHTDSWKSEIIEAETIPYTPEMEQKLRTAKDLGAEKLLALNTEFGFYLATCVEEFIKKHSVGMVDLIASHGHTVHHNPAAGYSYQLGDGRAIKLRTGIPTVYDFRSQDILMGGHGAPLVPIGDGILFGDFEACLNLGGISNISFKKDQRRIAFDICAVNIVLNRFAKILGQDYDEDGRLAKAGAVDKALLEKLNTLDYYKKLPPKSLGLEDVERDIAPLFEEIEAQCILATFTQHIADKISEVLNEERIGSVLITGGGAHNRFLIEKIQAHTQSKLIIPRKELVDYKEALIFGFLGTLRHCGQNNIIASTTGSAKDHSSGLIA